MCSSAYPSGQTNWSSASPESPNTGALLIRLGFWGCIVLFKIKNFRNNIGKFSGSYIIQLEQRTLVASHMPGGMAVKITNVKFGRSMSARLPDGYRSQQKAPRLSSLIFSRAIPADSRELAYASGMLSGGVTGPNQLVTLAQGIAAAPEGRSSRSRSCTCCRCFCRRIKGNGRPCAPAPHRHM